jgi:phosphohistidine swiveling domain-containing protein
MVREKLWDCVPGADFNEEHDLKNIPSWFLDGTHPVPAWTPFMSWLWTRLCTHGVKYAAQKLSIPTCKGWEMHHYKGRDYCTWVIVRDPEEIKQREAKFREALRPFIEDFDRIYSGHKEELMTAFKRLRSFDLDAATTVDLLYHMFDCLNTYRRMFELHFECMYPALQAWILFEGLCKDMFGIDDQSPEFQKLMVGFDNRIFQVDRRMWQLGQDAVKAGLADIFTTTEAREVIPKLEQTEAGRKWLKGFREFLNEDGWRMERLATLIEPTWIEEPTPAIANITGYIAKGGGFDLEVTRERLAQEREKAVAAIMQKVPEDKRQWFGALLRLAQKAGMFNEDHTYYCEYYGHAMVRRCLLAIGKRWVQGGTIERVDDIFFFNPEEIDSFGIAPEAWDLRYIVNRRRAEWEEWKKEDVPPVITTRAGIGEAVVNDLIPSGDVIALKIVMGEMPKVRPELKANLYGMRGSPGVSEGPARVIMSLEQVHEVQPGEILVAPTTSSSWTPVFGLIKGVVIDRGGTLSHGAIVAREYAIPAVVNTFEGSAKIKTGQRIRVDGGEGVVYILE